MSTGDEWRTVTGPWRLRCVDEAAAESNEQCVFIVVSYEHTLRLSLFAEDALKMQEWKMTCQTGGLEKRQDRVPKIRRRHDGFSAPDPVVFPSPRPAGVAWIGPCLALSVRF